MKQVLTISRYWTNPKIQTIITDESISLQVSLDDFISALKTEIGSVSFVFKKETFNAQLDSAVNKVLEMVKEESVKVI